MKPGKFVGAICAYLFLFTVVATFGAAMFNLVDGPIWAILSLAVGVATAVIHDSHGK